MLSFPTAALLIASTLGLATLTMPAAQPDPVATIRPFTQSRGACQQGVCSQIQWNALERTGLGVITVKARIGTFKLVGNTQRVSWPAKVETFEINCGAGTVVDGAGKRTQLPPDPNDAPQSDQTEAALLLGACRGELRR